MGKNNKKSSSFRQRSRSQFENKRGFKKVRRETSSHERRDVAPGDVETIYRLLCPTKKIGSVIGKGGDIIKTIRDETYAKIKVADSVPGSDERVVLISSSSTKQPNVEEDPESTNDTEKEPEEMEPHCPAQNALLKVHKRIAEDDYSYAGRTISEDDKENDLITARLLVPTNQIGCLIGKGGQVINELRSQTGANIRILASEHLPACAMGTDELVQISGTSVVAMRALYEISTRLHQNPRPPMNHSLLAGAPRDMLLQRNPVWPHEGYGSRGSPPMLRFGGRANVPFGFPEVNFDGGPARYSGNSSAEFSMKILCPPEKMGMVIGKGGINVNQIQQATRTDIHVDRKTQGSDEHVIIVSSFDAPWNPISPTIEAILEIQNIMVQHPNRRGEFSEVTTRLLVPSVMVGCLLGQGGHIVNEMRRRSKADIRIISDDGKPLCAANDEDLVQISGNVFVARDALVEISSRLRMRSLEGLTPPPPIEPGPVGHSRRFGSSSSFFEREPPPSNMIRAGGSGGYGSMKGGYRENGPQSYPDHAPNSGFPSIIGSMEIKIPNSALAASGSDISYISQMSGAKIKLNDSQSGGSDCIAEIRGSSEQMNAAQNLLQSFVASALQSFNSQQQQNPYTPGGYNFNQPQHHEPYASAPQNMSSQQHPYVANAAHKQPQEPYDPVPQNFNQHHDPYAATLQKQQEQQQLPYVNAVKQEQQQHPHASAVEPEQQQLPYASATEQDQQEKSQQGPYASALQNFNQQKEAHASAHQPQPQLQLQQQQEHYASSLQQQPQQQQDPYASVLQQMPPQQQDSYALAFQQQQQDPYASAQQQPHASTLQQQQQDPYVHNYNHLQQGQYAGVAHMQHDQYASNFHQANSQQQVPYATTQQLQDPYAPAAQQQAPYSSTYHANAQQPDPYASTLQVNVQQPDPYGSAVQNYNQQQQDPYASALQNPNVQQQQVSYDPSAHSYEAQQQAPYQY